jgi:nicotinamide riboside kinase
LTEDDIPFVQDGTRDGETIRHQMHMRFQEELIRRKENFTILFGSHQERMQKAIQFCNDILSI